MHEFDTAVMEILGTNARDVPFAALYHVETANGESPLALRTALIQRRQSSIWYACLSGKG
jgi:hypothetical protein